MKEVRYDKEGRPRILVGDRWRLAEKTECYHCGTMFWKQAGPPVKFCSPRCRGLNRTKLYQSKRVMKRCVICRRFFKVKAATAERWKTCGNPDCTIELRRRQALWRHAQPGQRVFKKQGANQ